MNCHPTLCGMQVTVRDDDRIEIAGDPGNPDSRGFLCLRGRVSGEILGNPLRVLHPRTRERRQQDAWKDIDAATALDAIAQFIETIEPEQLGIWLGHGDAATNYGTRIGGLISKRFAHMYGAQWWHPAMICWGLGGFGLALTGVLNVNTKEDLGRHSELIILWGANVASQPNTSPHLKAARQRGARVVTIDVRDSEASVRADQHIRIRPGTDAALALAMMHVIVEEQLVDTQFVGAHTLGYDELEQHVRAHDPQWASTLTGIDAEVIRQLARDYATVRPAMIVMGGSSMHKSCNGWEAPRAIACLPALTGNLGQPGAGIGSRHGASSHGQGLNSLVPEGPSRCRRAVPNQMSAMIEAMEQGQIKALLLSGTNMLSSFADTNRLRRALDNVELIVCHDLFASDTTREKADMVLPATAWLEQVGAKMTHTHLYLMEKALEPAGEAMTLTTILRGLAERVHVPGFFPWSDEEAMIGAIVNHPSTGHATIESIRRAGGICELNISHHAYPDHQYHTPSGKVEFVSSQAERAGLPRLPTCTQPQEQPRYPLRFRQGRSLTHFHGFYDHGRALPSLKKANKAPVLWISPQDAVARDITDGARVRIHNRRGEFFAGARVTDKIAEGTVWMRDGWAGINRLTSSEPVVPDVAVDLFPFSVGQAAYDANVEIELARQAR